MDYSNYGNSNISPRDALTPSSSQEEIPEKGKIVVEEVLFQRTISLVSQEKKPSKVPEISLLTELSPLEQKIAAKTAEVFKSFVSEEIDDKSFPGEISFEQVYLNEAINQYENLIDLLERPISESMLMNAENFYNQVLPSLAKSPEEALSRLEKARMTPNWHNLEERRVGGSGTIDEALLTESEPKQLEDWRNAELYCSQIASNRDKLTLQTISSFNAMVKPDVKEPGVFRPKNLESFVGSAGTYYVRPVLVEQAMDDFLQWFEKENESCKNALDSTKTPDNLWGVAKGKENPIVLAARTYQRLVSIHPFADGNGRATRLVMDFVLQSYGLAPVAFNEAKDVDVANFPMQNPFQSQLVSYATAQRANLMAEKFNQLSTPSNVVEKILDGIKLSNLLLFNEEKK